MGKYFQNANLTIINDNLLKINRFNFKFVHIGKILILMFCFDCSDVLTKAKVSQNQKRSLFIYCINKNKINNLNFLSKRSKKNTNIFFISNDQYYLLMILP